MHITDKIGAGVTFLTPVELEAEREAANAPPPAKCQCHWIVIDGVRCWAANAGCRVCKPLEGRYDVQPMVGVNRRGRKAERGKE
jgi:hypothetical protein